jgi:hypothetical protein
MWSCKSGCWRNRVYNVFCFRVLWVVDDQRVSVEHHDSRFLCHE